MGLSFRLLGSGSTGNATLVSDGETNILVDVGLSGRKTIRRLAECGVRPEEISAIVVSHEHVDHCRGLAPLVKNLNIPVFISDDCLRASGIPLDRRKHQSISSGVPFDVNGVLFTPFSLPHDAADPVGFCIEKSGIKLAIVLDLGYISNLVIERLRGCDSIVLESNHDLKMLRVGPYPEPLKQRINSRLGHLSNKVVAEYLAEEFDGKARHLVLAHLSKENNDPEVALASARQALEERSSITHCQTRIEVAKADEIGRRFAF